MTEVDPQQGSFITRVFRGFGYYLKGWHFVLAQHPGLIKYCLLPLLINVLILVLLITLAGYYYGDLVQLIWAKPEAWFWRALWYALYFLLFFVLLLIGYGLFFILQAVLAAPFNDLLSERVELLAHGQQPSPFSAGRFVRGLGLTLAHELLKLACYLGLMLPLFLLNWIIPVLGMAIFFIGGWYVTALFSCYDFIDLCMSRRQWAFSRKWQLIKGNKALAFGFGSAIALALLVPLLGLLAMPIAAAGGALLFSDLDRDAAISRETQEGVNHRGASVV